MRRRSALTSLGAAAAALAAPRSALADDAGSKVAAQAVLDRFLRAWENLDLEAMAPTLAADTTFFFPAPMPSERFAGRDAVLARFAVTAANLRKASNRTTPPFQSFVPEDLRVEQLGADVVLFTFHLRNDERFARRSFVLGRGEDGWSIVHAHGSNVPRARA